MKDAQILWVPKGPQEVMARKLGGKAKGDGLKASSGYSLFRGPYSMRTGDLSLPPLPSAYQAPSFATALGPQRPCPLKVSGQVGQSLLPATHQLPLRPARVGGQHLPRC